MAMAMGNSRRTSLVRAPWSRVRQNHLVLTTLGVAVLAASVTGCTRPTYYGAHSSPYGWTANNTSSSQWNTDGGANAVFWPEGADTSQLTAGTRVFVRLKESTQAGTAADELRALDGIHVTVVAIQIGNELNGAHSWGPKDANGDPLIDDCTTDGHYLWDGVGQYVDHFNNMSSEITSSGANSWNAPYVTAGTSPLRKDCPGDGHAGPYYSTHNMPGWWSPAFWDHMIKTVHGGVVPTADWGVHLYPDVVRPQVSPPKTSGGAEATYDANEMESEYRDVESVVPASRHIWVDEFGDPSSEEDGPACSTGANAPATSQASYRCPAVAGSALSYLVNGSTGSVMNESNPPFGVFAYRLMDPGRCTTLNPRPNCEDAPYGFVWKDNAPPHTPGVIKGRKNGPYCMLARWGKGSPGSPAPECPTSSSTSVMTTGTGSGTVTSSDGALACGSGGDTCVSDSPTFGSPTLTETPDSGSTFTGWSGDCSGTATTCTPSSNSNNQSWDVGATFSAPAGSTEQRVSVSTVGNGAGSVTSSPTGINCGATCDFITLAPSVTLTASPATGSNFIGWSGGCSGSSSTCTLSTVKGNNLTATAEFEPPSGAGGYTIFVAKAGTGSGTVSSLPLGIIDCGTTCGGATAANPVTLTAIPDAGSTFTGWSGSCTGVLPACALTMNGDKDLTATFSR